MTLYQAPPTKGRGFLRTFMARDDGTTWTLSNDDATYNFVEGHGGLSLVSFQRDGGQLFTNDESCLWRAIVFDSTSTSAISTYVIGPNKHQMEWVGTTADGLAAAWEVPIGPDTLRVTIDMTLDGDSLEIGAICEWKGTPTVWAVDSICVMPLRMRWDDVGNDAAFLGAIKGAMVRNPRYRFRFVPEDTDQPNLGWQNKHRSLGSSPSGKSVAMSLWGYFSESDYEGWMLWVDTHADEILSGHFESYQDRLLWQYWIPQPGWISAGNGGNDLETATRFRLRPYLGGDAHAWWDAADHYRSRMEIKKPEHWKAKTQLDPDLLPEERRPFIWCDFSMQSYSGDQKTEITGAVDLLRTQVSATTDTPVYGWIVGKPEDSRVLLPANPPINGNTSRAGIQEAHGVPLGGLKNAFLGLHRANKHYPRAYNEGVWGDGTIDFWTEKDWIKAYTVQRQGAIDGESDTTRGTSGSEEDNDYYRQDTFTVDTFDADTLTITTTAPVGNWDKPAQTAASILLSSGKRATTVLTSTGVSSVVLDGLFTDATGATHSIAAGDTFTLADRESSACHHVILGSDMEQWLRDYFIREQRDNWKNSLFYMDEYPAQSMRNKTMTCSGTHAGWSELEAGYTAHPAGGGSWWVDSSRDYFEMWRDAARSHQSPGVAWLGQEYLDERYLPHSTMGLHTTGYLKLWRNYFPYASSVNYDDPDDHGMRPIPLFHVVYAGRGFCLQRSFNFGNGALSTLVRNDDDFPTDAPKYRKANAMWMCGEWVWGMTPPTYMHTAHDTLTDGTNNLDIDVSLWDDDQYSGGGAAVQEIKDLRDLWVSLVKAELKWATTYLRNGQLGPPGVDQGSSTVSAEDAFDQTSAALGNSPLSSRNDLPMLWDIKNYPRVMHGAWVRDGAVCVFLLNWTDTSGTTHVTYTFSRYGLSGEVVVYTLNANGVVSRQGSFWSSYTDNQSVGAHTLEALLFAPESLTETHQIVSDITQRAYPNVIELGHYAAVVSLEVEVRDDGAVLDISSATSKTINALLPDGTTLAAPGTFVTDGTDGRMYVDLNGGLFRTTPGVWEVQGLVTIAGDDKVGSFDQIVAGEA